MTKRKQYKCQHCNHEWTPRKPEKPKLCPNPHCHTPHWERKNG